MSQVKRIKVSFVDKDTMCIVDPMQVEVINVSGELVATFRTPSWLNDTVYDFKEVEIKFN